MISNVDKQHGFIGFTECDHVSLFLNLLTKKNLYVLGIPRAKEKNEPNIMARNNYTTHAYVVSVQRCTSARSYPEVQYSKN